MGKKLDYVHGLGGKKYFDQLKYIRENIKIT